MRGRALRCLAIAFALALTAGCTAIQKGLGIKQDLHDEQVAGITPRLDRPALCPGEEGWLIVDVALADGRALRTEGAGDGKVTAVDGPFAETKEQLAGFYAIEAKDLDEAIEFASRIPPARYGTIEVRPMRTLMEKGNIR